MDPLQIIIPVVFLVVALVVSLAQSVWTWRVTKRVRTWLGDERAGVELVSFASVSRWAQWMWFGGVVIAVVLFIDTSQNVGVNTQPSLALIAAVTFWCLIQLIISWKSQEMCRSVSRFAMTRQLGEQGLAEAATLIPGGVGSVISEDVLKRRVNSLEVVSLIVMLFLSGSLALALLGLMAAALDSIVSSAGQLLLMFLFIVLPGFIALYVVRCVVEARARRAQFLWFLAATTQNQRPLASELMAWGCSHPGRYGSRVMEVARDIGVGESLADALESQRGLLIESDLMSVRVAEQTGTLAETLRDCAVRQTQSLKGESWASNASGTVVWLWAVVVVAVTITSFLMYYIVPKFKAIFLGFGTELPGVTVLLITLSDLFVRYGVLWFPFFVLLSMVMLWSSGEAFLRGWPETWLAWRLGFGRQSEIPRLLRRMRGAVVAKLPWPTALQPMVLKHPQSEIRSRLERVLGRVTAGMGVWPAMRDSGLLNSRDVSLLEMAERANNLAWTLAALAESKERSLAHRWHVLVTLAVPVFTVLAGLMVFLICVGFFMPLVKLLNDLS